MSALPAATRPLRVAIVNDYEVVVAGVAAMLDKFRDRVEVVEYDIRLPVVKDVDLVLFDTFALVADRGIGVRDLVHSGGPKVVLYTWTTDPCSVEDAMAQGAVGHLSKAMSPADLVTALEGIHAGVPAPVALDEPVNHHGSGDWPGHEFDLAPREAEVLALIAQGLTNDEIAKALYLSINSIKTYIRTGYHKIDVQRRSQAVAWALGHGFTVEHQRSFPDPS